MLTEAEKQACRTATYLKGRGHLWGTPAEGLCPMGAVAVLRGAQPLLRDGEYAFLEKGKEFQKTENWKIATQAITDVLEWVGYRGKPTGFGDFLDALERDGLRIFEGLP